MSTRPNAAILFEPGAYDADRKQVMGRHVAGASFLNGFVRHAEVDSYVGVGLREAHAPNFRRQVQEIVAGRPDLAGRPVRVLTPGSQAALSAIGTFYIPDPTLPRFALARRLHDQRAYSLCGITHTIASRGVMETLSDMLTAPVQSWDALICTSRSVRNAVLRQQEYYADYLEQRIGKRPSSPVQTPIIPLGVDADRFERLGADSEARQALRRQIGAEEHDLVVLFFGRLAFHAKAHPVPMYLGAQRAAKRLGPREGRIHLIQTGQFPNKVAEDGYRDGAALCCPDVPVHFLDGADRWLADASWAAADAFVSLSDNIQESFGITPVEAMAAGLPCLVSDWDGYRDTVVDGETGIRVPTWLPPRGIGSAIADSHATDGLSYDLYIGYASQMTPVDVPAIADALVSLARDPETRRRMGEAGRRRVRAMYDWSVIVRAYQDLWTDLAERRRADVEIAPPQWYAKNPRFTDPFEVFVGHASAILGDATVVRVDELAPDVDALMALPCNNFAAQAMLEPAETAEIVELLRAGAQRVDDCLRRLAPERRIRGFRTLAWLVKYGVLVAETGAETGKESNG